MWNVDCFPRLCSSNKWPFHEVSLHFFFFFFPASRYIPQRIYSSTGYWLMVSLCVPFNFAINQQGVETTNLKRIDLFIWLDPLEWQADWVISVWSWGRQEEPMRRNPVLSTTMQKRTCLSSHCTAAGQLFSAAASPFAGPEWEHQSFTRLSLSSRTLNSVGLQLHWNISHCLRFCVPPFFSPQGSLGSPKRLKK